MGNNKQQSGEDLTNKILYQIDRHPVQPGTIYHIKLNTSDTGMTDAQASELVELISDHMYQHNAVAIFSTVDDDQNRQPVIMEKGEKLLQRMGWTKSKKHNQ